MTEPLTVFAPLRVEADRLRQTLPGAAVQRCGAGPRRAASAARSPEATTAPAVAVAGIGAGLDPSLRPGDVVVATRVHGPEGTVDCPSAPLLAGALRREGLTVRLGPVVSVPHVVYGAERSRLAAEGHLCADMESGWLLAGAGARPRACVRVVADAAPNALLRPTTLRHVRRALGALPAVGRGLARWSAVLDQRRVLLAAPRSFCAGVERAIEVVEKTLDHYGPPVYVRKQIVHNVHVVRDLASRGAVFVDELDEVPPGARVIFSAHGVSPGVRATAGDRELDVIDATCPLVTKVHTEARRFASADDTIVLVGHAGHEEIEGTMGEAPERTVLVQDAEDAKTVEVADPSKVAYLVQTTLASDEVSEVVDVLRERFPELHGPPSDDICYATTNRQQALREVAQRADLVLVLGSENSSNSRRLVEVARREGAEAHLIDDVTDIDLDWLAGAGAVGVTAGASAPPELVDQVREALEGLGPVEATEHSVTTENVHFQLPKEVRHA